MSTYNTNYEIAQAINQRIGTAPVPFEDLRNISFQIYQGLGGENSIEDFDDIYQLLLTTRTLAHEGSVGLIDDTSVRTDKTWSSDKINSELSGHYTKIEADTLFGGKQDILTAGENIDITDNTISAVGYKFNGDTNGGFAEKYKQDDTDGGLVVENTATGLGSHAEGYNTTASGDYGCHAEGNLTQATGYVTHAEGNLTKASETASHAEGGETEAKANYAHAEGYQTKAMGRQSHAEGGHTKAKGLRAHAEGEGASADSLCAVGDNSHTEGLFTQAQNYAEHAQGAANVSHKTASNAATAWQGDGNHTLHSIGNGRYTNTQSNAVEVMQNADVYIKGVGGYDGVHIKSEAGYETVKTLQQVISGKQDVLTAGQNIVITNNTISAVIDAGFHIEVVQTLPATGEVNTIYFVPKAGGANPDVYDEYMYINNAWEKIGSTEVDLTNYYNKTEVDTLLSGKQATLTAGNNITINGSTISANDTTYSAGDNIEITDNTIKAVGYRYNTNNGAFAEGDRDIIDSDVTRPKPSATGVMAHAEGSKTKAIGRVSHAEGNGGSAIGVNSHVEGSEGNAIGVNSHVEGRQAVTNGYASHAEGAITETGGNYGSATTNPKTADSKTGAGDYAHAEGNACIAYGVASHAEGRLAFAKGRSSHAEGGLTVANGVNSHAEGGQSAANGPESHAEGKLTVANGEYSHAEGTKTITKNTGEHAEGISNISHTDNEAIGSSGKTIHSIGVGVTGARKNAVEVMQNGDAYLLGVGNYNGIHIKGQSGAPTGLQTLQETVNGKQDALTAGNNIHIGGNTISALGYEYNSANISIANGDACVIDGEYSHAEGYQCVTESTASYSHAEGVETVVRNQNEHAQGRCNVSHLADDTVTNHEGNTIVSVGVGEDDTNRKNAFEIMQNGDIYVYGLGNYNGTETKFDNPSVMTLQDILRIIAEEIGVNIGVLA